ncbi:MAG: hypothetical protein ABWW65_02970 [Thermoprotei archaeon]
MPKTPSVIVREELWKRGYELLDIYHYKDKDILRVKHRGTGKVFLYEIRKHVRDLTNREEIINLVNSIISFFEENISKK